MTIEYSTGWFTQRIQTHSEVAAAVELPSGHVRLSRTELAPIIVAPVRMERLEVLHVDRILEAGDATVICLIPKMSHYMWEAREHALERGSAIHTMKELYAALTYEDPRPFLNKNVAFARDRLEQHSEVLEVRMVCESSMELVRRAGLSSVCVAIEYEYEFSEESLVKALKHHPEVDAVLNSNPNGTPTRAALQHAREARVGLFGLGQLRGALRHDGDSFLYYPLPDRNRG